MEKASKPTIQGYGVLAQLGEHLPYKHTVHTRGVAGSNPVSATRRKAVVPIWYSSFF